MAHGQLVLAKLVVKVKFCDDHFLLVPAYFVAVAESLPDRLLNRAARLWVRAAPEPRAPRGTRSSGKSQANTGRIRGPRQTG